LQRNIRLLNNKLKNDPFFEETRKIRTTELIVIDNADPLLSQWIKPDERWCKLSEELCIPNRARGAINIKKGPFQAYKTLPEDELGSIEDTNKKLAKNILFF
jgi:hypothetical protein